MVVKNCTITTAPVAFGNYDRWRPTPRRRSTASAPSRSPARKGRPPRWVWASAATRKAPRAGWPVPRRSFSATSSTRTPDTPPSGATRRHRARHPRGAEPQSAQLHHLRARCGGTRCRRRQLHRYRRRDGELLGERDVHATSTLPRWHSPRCYWRPRPQTRPTSRSRRRRSTSRRRQRAGW